MQIEEERRQADQHKEQVCAYRAVVRYVFERKRFADEDRKVFKNTRPRAILPSKKLIVAQMYSVGGWQLQYEFKHELLYARYTLIDFGWIRVS